MNETHDAIERKLAGLVPTEPAGSMVDAAYEAGRRDALAERAKSSFPALKLAAVVVLSMGLAGVGGFVAGQGGRGELGGRSPSLAAQPAVPQSGAPEVVDRDVEVEVPAPPSDRPILVSTPWQPPHFGPAGSPISILSMRSAVLTPRGVMLDRLPAGSGGGSGSGEGIPTPRMTWVELDGLDL